MNTQKFIENNKQDLTVKKIYRVSYSDERPDEIVTMPVEDADYFENEWEHDDKVTDYREAEEDDLRDEQETIHYWTTKDDFVRPQNAGN